eukprot:CAMPEP_0119047596 /NCGR_PEP_ID=MMETSP1177-20130426/54054_1 /TAXON_ID=2985 /ORGANISM="Ochromonas sp, Strain CCMP1899" /LENGTH=969 /DNA_ID=CAMNT_0007022385 /DNA_START=511 /DNA_END=3419 /DNA_ORIENTATION=+
MSYQTQQQSEGILKESINDANDRAIRTCSLFYRSMVEGYGSVVMVSNDADNQRKAINEGIQCMSMRGYILKYLQDYPELLDLLANDSSADKGSMRAKVVYPGHSSMSVVSIGLKSKKILKGTIRVKRDDWTDCYVVVHTAEGEPRRSVQIKGRLHVNRAVDGDLVAIEVLGDETEAERRAEREIIRLEGIDCGGSHLNDQGAAVSEETLEATPEAIEGLNVKTITESTDTGIIRGKVVGIVRRGWRQYAGSLDSQGHGDRVDGSGNGSTGEEERSIVGTSCLFYPVDKKMPAVRIDTRRREELKGQRLLVSLDQWPVDSVYPQGHYVRVLGKDGDKDVETQVLLHEFDVPCASFSAEVMACLPPQGWAITEELIAQRTDLRHIPVVSIDPPGCKDIDDALHCIRLPNGNLEAGVHIADVSHFVHPDTAIDKEAAHRSTSTYLVERRLDMLPGYLTTELCSLRSTEDHLAFSVMWEMDDEGNILDVRFCKSAIRSVASLTYDQAQEMLDDPSCNDQVGASVKLLNKIARILRQRRIDEGALTLASPEVRFKLDSETQNPTDVAMYALKESNALVEEFMLLANITVSKKMLRHYPTLAVLRRHQPPSREQFLPLLSAAAAVGIRLDISSSKTLADTLDLAVKEDDPYFNKLLRIMSTRCMMPAQYFCSGEIDKSQWHHYGLAAPVYTHFTSPIRRYADVIVHRLLSASIGVISLPAANADRSRQQDLASHMNRRHRAAQHAQRASVNLNTLIYFKNRPSVEVAYVLSVAQDKIVVIVPRFGIEGSLILDPIASVLTGSERVAEGEVSTNVKYDAVSHVVSIFKNEGDEVLRIGVFEKVQISIKVREGRAGSRRLILGLVVDGKDLAEKDGTESEEGLQVMEINEEEEDVEVEGGNTKMSLDESELDVETPSKRSKTEKEDKGDNNGGKQIKTREVKTELRKEVKVSESEDKSNKKTEKKIDKEKRPSLRKK